MICPRQERFNKERVGQTTLAGFIKEIYHPEWLANPVLVKKKNSNKWRMCVDYIDLNKHCPKDPFGLPRTDQVINSIARCTLLSFLDCYSAYRSPSRKKIKSRLHWSRPTAPTATRPCLLAWRMQGQHTKEQYSSTSPTSSTTTSKLTWAMWSSRHEILTTSPKI